MLKGLRWPLAALVLASGLLILALATRPDSSPADPTATPAPVPVTEEPTATAEPVASDPLPVQSTPLPPQNVLVEALVGQINKLNPLLATYNQVDQDITSLIFEGLTTTNEYGEIVPDLAQSWRVSDDGLQYLVVLREDVLWQDGIPFTAEDVVFTVDLMSDPDFPGADSLREFWRTIEADALDDHLVRFRLTQPLASFTDQLRIGIVPAHVLKGVPVADLGRHPFNLSSPIGTGPYQIETLTASGGQIDGIQLRVAPVYRQRPEGAEGFALDRIIFRTYSNYRLALEAYAQGEVNGIGAINARQLDSARQMADLSLYTAVDPRVGVLIYNWKRDDIRFVRNPRARLALAHAVDRANLVNTYLAGRAILADSPLLPNSWAYESQPWPEYDMEQAQYMLDTANLVVEEPPASDAAETPTEPAPEEGGIPDGNDETAPDGETVPEEPPAEEEATPVPIRFSMTILTLDDDAMKGIADGIAASWGQLGLTTSVETTDTAGLHARLAEGDFDAALIELSFAPNADPDPYVFWHQGQYGTGQNYGGMDDRRVSETLEAARRDPNGLNRITYYHRFQELFAERVPALVMYYPLYTYAVDERLAGVQLGFLSAPSDRFRSIKEWTFTP